MVINLIARMEQVVQSYVADKQFMGSIIVSQNGKILLCNGYGYANLEWEIPNSPSTKFRIGSLTKQFTAASILLLEEKGKIKITDLINKYIIDAPSTWNNISIFNLLTHTSGIPNYTALPDFTAMTTSTKTPKQQIDFFRDRPLDFQPGSQYAYNNSGYVLLGYLIEVISGESYQDFVVNNIFKQLSMQDSGYDSHSAIIPHRACGYQLTLEGILNADYLDMSVPYSAGSLYSTTQDLLKWQEGLFGGKVLSFESLTKMTTPFKNNYGFGVIVKSVDGCQSIFHAGGINGFNTIMIYYPENKLTVISLSNLNAIGYVAQDIAFKMVKLVQGKTITLPSEREEIILSSGMLAKYTGKYKLTTTNISYPIHSINFEISVEDGNLVSYVPNQPKIRLFAESETKFFGKIPDVQIEFIKDEDGKIYRLFLRQDGERLIGERIS